jgi:hypothetical protein
VSEKTEVVLSTIANFFLDSNDFNGIPLSDLESDTGISGDDLGKLLTELLRDGKISLVFDINPHVKRFPDLPAEEQIKRLTTERNLGCAYPTPAVLASVVRFGVRLSSPLPIALGSSAKERSGGLPPQFSSRLFSPTREVLRRWIALVSMRRDSALPPALTLRPAHSTQGDQLRSI